MTKRKQNIVAVKVRIRVELRKEIARVALKDNRSVNQEMARRLEKSLSTDELEGVILETAQATARAMMLTLSRAGILSKGAS